MTDQTIQPKDDRLLTPRDLAKRWSVTLWVLRKRRNAGEGPTYNRALRGYMLSDIIAFEDGGLVPKQQLAERWGIGLRALEKREVEGNAPARLKIGGRSYYRLNEIVAMEKTKGGA